MLAVTTAAVGGLLTGAVLVQTLLFLPIALLGVFVGGGRYRRAQGDIRRVVLWLLAALSTALVLQAART